MSVQVLDCNSFSNEKIGEAYLQTAEEATGGVL